MIVCLCQAVSDRTIRKAARDGASSVGEVKRACGAGTGCGACCAAIGELVREERKKSEARHASCGAGLVALPAGA